MSLKERIEDGPLGGVGIGHKPSVYEHAFGFQVTEAWALHETSPRPHDPMDITITGSSGAKIDEIVSGGDLTELAPETAGTNQRSRVNWTNELLRTLCLREALDEVERIINEQQGQ